MGPEARGGARGHPAGRRAAPPTKQERGLSVNRWQSTLRPDRPHLILSSLTREAYLGLGPSPER